MTAKLLTILITLGLASLALLSERQQRIDIAWEMAGIHERCDDVRTGLWSVRSRIAQLTATLPHAPVLAELDEPTQFAIRRSRNDGG